MSRILKRTISFCIAAIIIILSGCKGPEPADTAPLDVGGQTWTPVGKPSETPSGTMDASPHERRNIGITDGFRGVEFNPYVIHATFDGYMFPYFRDYDGAYREGIKAALRDLVDKGFNYIAVWLCNLHTMKTSIGIGNKAGSPIEEWGNLNYLDSFALFLNDCYEADINVGVDLVDNRWVPYSVRPNEHIGKPGGWWPQASDEPWKEAATWYTEVIEYIEAKVMNTEVIAMWNMMGNFQWGASEPVLWDDLYENSIVEHTEIFVKYVWPQFVAAGTRPKGSPYVFPILSDNSYWMARTPLERLSGFINLHKWLVLDLGLPPDYWLMTTYAYCDPIDDYNYLEKISEILGEGNDAKIITTDFKLTEAFRGTIINPDGLSRQWPDMIKWHLDKADDYGYAGWWIWAYQDRPDELTGLKDTDGNWKDGVLDAIFNR